MRVEDFINENRDKIVEVHWNETIKKYVKNLSLSEVLLNELRKEDYFNLSSNFFVSLKEHCLPLKIYFRLGSHENFRRHIQEELKLQKAP